MLEERNSILEDKKRITTLENEITRLNSDKAMQMLSSSLTYVMDSYIKSKLEELENVKKENERKQTELESNIEAFKEVEELKTKIDYIKMMDSRLISVIDSDIKSKQEELENVKKENERKQTELESNIEAFKEEKIAKIEEELKNYVSKTDYAKLKNEILNLENEKKRCERIISDNEKAISNIADEFEKGVKIGEIHLYIEEIRKINRIKRLKLSELSTIEDNMKDVSELKYLIMRIRGLNSDNLDKVDLSEIDKRKAEKDSNETAIERSDAEKDLNETAIEKSDAEKAQDENMVKGKSIYRKKRELQNEIKELKAKNPAEGTEDAKRLSECENKLKKIQQEIKDEIARYQSEMRQKFSDNQTGKYYQNATEKNTNIDQSQNFSELKKAEEEVYTDIGLKTIQNIEIIEKGKKEKEIKINGEDAEFKRKLLRRDGMKKEVSKICKQLFEGKRFSKIRAIHLIKKLDPAIINAIGKDKNLILSEYIEAIAKKRDLPFDLTYKIQGPQKLKDKKYVRAAKKAKATIINEHKRKFFSKKEDIKAISSGENVQDSQTHEDSEFKKILRRS